MRLALENEATQEEGTAEKKVHVDSAASIAASEAVTADSEVGSRGREGTKVKRGGKGGPRRQKGPKVRRVKRYDAGVSPSDDDKVFVIRSPHAANVVQRQIYE